VKPTNKAGQPAAEPVERRAGAEGNTGEPRTRRAPYRGSVSPGLERVRQAARQRKKERFTALLHHVTVELLGEAFYALKRNAAPGVDGLRWQDYEAGLEAKTTYRMTVEEVRERYIDPVPLPWYREVREVNEPAIGHGPTLGATTRASKSNTPRGLGHPAARGAIRGLLFAMRLLEA
jgi:hypothetical protein